MEASLDMARTIINNTIAAHANQPWNFAVDNNNTLFKIRGFVSGTKYGVAFDISTLRSRIELVAMTLKAISLIEHEECAIAEMQRYPTIVF